MHHFIPIKVLPNNFIRSHAIITMNAAPSRYLLGSFGCRASFGTDVWSVAVPTPAVSAKTGDEALGIEGVSFLF
jgi:hypothetical protein